MKWSECFVIFLVGEGQGLLALDTGSAQRVLPAAGTCRRSWTVQQRSVDVRRARRHRFARQVWSVHSQLHAFHYQMCLRAAPDVLLPSSSRLNAAAAPRVPGERCQWCRLGGGGMLAVR